jgi:hypothetical protein
MTVFLPDCSVNIIECYEGLTGVSSLSPFSCLVKPTWHLPQLVGQITTIDLSFNCSVLLAVCLYR